MTQEIIYKGIRDTNTFCKNCLKEDGTLVLIGPTENNSWEVDDFCFQLYGQAPTSKERANRLESEFAPLLKSLGLLIVSERINFDLTFPDSDQYLKYLTSTLQFRLSYNGSLDREVSKNIIAEKYNKTLTKEIVCLRAKRI